MIHRPCISHFLDWAFHVPPTSLQADRSFSVLMPVMILVLRTGIFGSWGLLPPAAFLLLTAFFLEHSNSLSWLSNGSSQGLGLGLHLFGIYSIWKIVGLLKNTNYLCPESNASLCFGSTLKTARAAGIAAEFSPNYHKPNTNYSKENTTVEHWLTFPSCNWTCLSITASCHLLQARRFTKVQAKVIVAYLAGNYKTQNRTHPILYPLK